MHKKDIKAQVRKQLKTKFPNWHRLTRKEKREIAQKVLNAVAEAATIIPKKSKRQYRN